MVDSPKRSTVRTSELKLDTRQLTLEDWAQMLEEDATSLQKSPDHAPERSAAPSEAQLVSAGVALLTTREVADALHVHPRTVQRLVERGELAVVRLGGAIRFDPAELVRLIAERTRIVQPSEQPTDTLRARPTGVSFAKRLRSQPA